MLKIYTRLQFSRLQNCHYVCGVSNAKILTRAQKRKAFSANRRKGANIALNRTRTFLGRRENHITHPAPTVFGRTAALIIARENTIVKRQMTLRRDIFRFKKGQFWHFIKASLH